jgi:autotransporter-associated beta strand protein
MAPAVNLTWTGATGDWFDNGNWDLGVYPHIVDYAYINNGGTATIAAPNGAAKRIYLGQNAGESGTIVMTDGNLETDKQFYVGNAGTGVVEQSGGIVYIPGDHLCVGYASGGSGSYTLSGAGQVVVGDNVYVGRNGTGAFTQYGGSLTCYGAVMVGASGENGTYVLNDGLFNAGYLTVGASFGSSTPTFTQTGGSSTVGVFKTGLTGVYALSAGALKISQGGMINEGTIDLTNSTGTLEISLGIADLSAGSIVTTGQSATLSVDEYSMLILPAGYDLEDVFGTVNNAGVVHTAASDLTLTSGQTVYGNADLTDHVNCQDATLFATFDSDIYLRNGLTVSGAASSVNLGGGMLYVNDSTSGISDGTMTVEEMRVSHYSDVDGKFTQSGGTANFTSRIYLAYTGDDTATYELSGGELNTNYCHVGNNGVADFIHTGGTHNSSSVAVASNTGSDGAYELSGSALLNATQVQIGGGGVGRFNQTSGTNTTNSIELGFGWNSTSHGIYNLEGGLLITGAITQGSGEATFNFGGGTLQASAAFDTSVDMTLTGTGGDARLDTAGFDVTLSGVLDGPGGLEKLGDGVLTLAGMNTYTGDTTVSGGILALADTGSLLFNINDPGDDYTQILGSGTLNLDGTLSLDLSDVSVTTGSWSLVDSSLTTTYGESFAMNTLGGGEFTGSEGVWSHTDGLGRVWTFTEATGALTAAAVPEPATWTIVMAAMAVLLAVRNRQ